MIKLIDILFEAKQVGILYHFTSLNSLSSMIMMKNKVILSIEYASYAGDTYISFTRNPRLGTLGKSKHETKITLDGDKMSNKYKFEPHVHKRYSYDDRFAKYSKDYEAEERINASKYGNKIDITPYILKIETITEEAIAKEYEGTKYAKMVLDDYDTIKTWCQKKNIPFSNF